MSSSGRLPFDDEETLHLRGVRLPPSREASADHRSLGGGGQPDLTNPPEGGSHEEKGPIATAIVNERELPDRAAREHAVDPRHNVVLEASAGTGKTRVLVDRYVNLLKADVDPSSILAITFTRKAAAEMRQRIVDRLREGASRSPAEAARWRDLRDRLGEISISTIDAFCLSLLREFPLEADLDPGFTVADESEVPRLVGTSLDRAMRICRAIARDDVDVALVFAQLSERRLRAGLANLLARRLVAGQALQRFLTAGPRDLTPEAACARGAERIRDALMSVDGGLDSFLEDGPRQGLLYQLVASDIRELCRADADTSGMSGSAARAAIDRIRDYFVTQDGKTRKRIGRAHRKGDAASPQAWQRHGAALVGVAPRVSDAIRAFRRDLNVVLSRGVWRIFNVALDQYRRTLDTRAALDFSELLLRARDLLAQMDEFARSRYRLEARYQHVLVDEFQDTSRAQWDLVSQLIRSWGEGFGLAHEAKLPPSIFIVGDRKQSIYGFRDAEVEVLREAAGFIATLRPEPEEPRAISHSFRSVPSLLAFVNDLCAAIDKVEARPDAFVYHASDAFPIEPDDSPRPQDDALGIMAADTPEACAATVATEVARLLADGMVRDRQTGARRRARPADIAVLFRSRESHRDFEEALEARGIPAYVYKGLGFFDADEIKDLIALLRYLAEPASDLRASAFLRSRFVQLSDEALRVLAPHLAAAIGSDVAPSGARSAPKPAKPSSRGRWMDYQGQSPWLVARLAEDDRARLTLAHQSVEKWLALADRIPPADLLDLVLAESAYAAETRGPRRVQARENIKKMRGLVRRIQNHGYATLARIADHLDRLSAGDESNAVIDAVDAVNLMTIHAAKGLEFPIVFLVNLARGTGGPRAAIRFASRGDGAETHVSIGDYSSPADEDVRARDLEETKRLVYVAVTRARDRLYLASVLKDGRLRPGIGSLAEVLPTSLRDLFPLATGTSGDSVQWSVAHSFRVCSQAVDTAPALANPLSSSPASRSPLPAPRSPIPDPRPPIPDPRPPIPDPRPPIPDPIDAFGPLDDRDAVPRVSVVRLAALVAEAWAKAGLVAKADDIATIADDRVLGLRRSRSENALVGAVVHQLLQHWPARPERDRVRRTVREALVERGEAAEIDGLVDRAAGVYRQLAERADVRALLDAGERMHEVAMSVALGPADLRSLGIGELQTPVVARGSIDCLVIRPDGAVSIVEFKTGEARPSDLVQLELYKRAVCLLFPEAPVDATIVYVG